MSSATSIAQRHLPVLKRRCVELLSPALEKEGAVLVDATLGMGGHSQAVLEALPHVRVVGIDRDRQALELAGKRLEEYGDRFTSFHGTYDQIPQVAARFGRAGKVDAVLFDLGVSSLQLDEVQRGFSYSQDAALDMRMDQSQGRTAADILATSSAQELTQILRLWGEEKFASRIAKNIVERRQLRPIETTGQLVEIIRDSIPAPARRTGGNPAKRTFQALRIAVNQELDILSRAIPAALQVVPVGGRVVVESYQSLEDRLVKQVFRQATTAQVPPGLPVTDQEAQGEFKLLTKGAEKADQAELEHNPRSASVRLRAVERIQDPTSETKRN